MADMECQLCRHLRHSKARLLQALRPTWVSRRESVEQEQLRLQFHRVRQRRHLDRPVHRQLVLLQHQLGQAQVVEERRFGPQEELPGP